MKIIIDSDWQIRNPQIMRLKRGDMLFMDLYFVGCGCAPVDAPNVAVQFGAKDDFLSDFLVYAEFERIEVDGKAYLRGYLTLDTVGLTNLIGDEDEVVLKAEFQFTQGTQVFSSRTIKLRIANDVIRGNEQVPVPAPNYPTWDQIKQYIDEVLLGQAGAIVGKSAYEIAVLNGFEGTEQEWLASLKGEKGDIGQAGQNGVGVLPGMIVWWARPKDGQGNFQLPAGYLMCYGQAISRTTYQALFAAIGGAYGAGDGSTTFNVPNLFDGNGRFIRSAHWSKAVGATESDAMRNIYGSYQVYKSGESIQGFSGAYNVYKSGATGGHGHGSQADGPTTLNVEFDASRVVAVAGEVRPYNIALVPLIKY